MTLSNLYSGISPDLAAFAKRVGVEPFHLAAGLADPLHFADHFDFEELAKLKASGPARPLPTHQPPMTTKGVQ